MINLTKHGGGSPYQNLTFLKKISLVSLPRSRRTILLKISHVISLTISRNDRISSCREDKELRQHI